MFDLGVFVQKDERNYDIKNNVNQLQKMLKINS